MPSNDRQAAISLELHREYGQMYEEVYFIKRKIEPLAHEVNLDASKLEDHVIQKAFRVIEYFDRVGRLFDEDLLDRRLTMTLMAADILTAWNACWDVVLLLSKTQPQRSPYVRLPNAHPYENFETLARVAARWLSTRASGLEWVNERVEQHVKYLGLPETQTGPEVTMRSEQGNGHRPTTEGQE